MYVFLSPYLPRSSCTDTLIRLLALCSINSSFVRKKGNEGSFDFCKAVLYRIFFELRLERELGERLHRMSSSFSDGRLRD